MSTLKKTVIPAAIAVFLIGLFPSFCLAETFSEMSHELDLNFFGYSKDYVNEKMEAGKAKLQSFVNENSVLYNKMTMQEKKAFCDYLIVYYAVADLRKSNGRAMPKVQLPVDIDAIASRGTQRNTQIDSDTATSVAVIGGIALAAGALYYGGKAVMGALANSGGSSTSNSSSPSYSPSLYDYSCKVYCLEPSGTTKVVIKAEDSSNAAKLVSAQSRQVCQNAGYGREHPSNMGSSQCQLK